jgi:hypothetical protein
VWGWVIIQTNRKPTSLPQGDKAQPQAAFFTALP